MITLHPGKDRLTADMIKNIVLKNEKIELHPDARENVNKSFEFLKEFSKDKIIYGVNTGFGPMAPYHIGDSDIKKLQYNLIRSHASGSGDIISSECVKASMLARLNTLLLGYSGVNKSVVRVLQRFINENIYPHIYEHGGVGASGDLVQLSHLALALIGEGYVKYEGTEFYTGDLMRRKKIQPIDILIREGLALINGTSVMTGISFLNLIYAKKLVSWTVVLSSLINEIVNSYDDHYSEELNGVKQHEGQQLIAGMMRKVLSDSKQIKRRQDHLYNGKQQGRILKDKVQEYYSLRCVPQILGPIYDAVMSAEKVLENEVNSVNDNPIIDATHENVYHGGNFHGDYVAFEADKLKIAITKLTMLNERQLNFLMNAKINQILPPFVNLGTLGLNLGMQGAQFTAVSTTAENQMYSNPMYVHSIPNNNDNQDIVSMGTNAALSAKKVVHNSFEVMAVQLLSLLQAVDYLDIENKLSSLTKKIYTEARELVPKFSEDTPKFEALERLARYLKETDLDLTDSL
jgi:histidine ammonia-lyase